MLKTTPYQINNQINGQINDRNATERDIGVNRLRYSISDHQSLDVIITAIGNACSNDADVTNGLIAYLEDHDFKVSCVDSLFVQRADRGKGIGKRLMQDYMDQVAVNTDMDFLFASTGNHQAPGFDLEKFYEQFGYKSVIYSYASETLLMVTKGHELGLIDYIDTGLNPSPPL